MHRYQCILVWKTIKINPINLLYVLSCFIDIIYNIYIQKRVAYKMYQYKICLTMITIAVLSLGMILNRLYFAVIILAASLCWFITNLIIPKLSQYMLKAQVYGYDINKKGSQQGQKKIPQCIGFACAVSFIIVSYFYYPYGQSSQKVTLETLNIHNTCLITILSTVLLGFADDMIDLAWRYKLIFPFIYLFPIVRVYNGSTLMPLPYPLSSIFGQSVDLGIGFSLYIIILGIYCTNNINIYAGINGLQVGQSIVAACSQLILYSIKSILYGQSNKYEYSSFLLLCLLGTSLAIMKYNAYPSQVFVGDTYCYFAGIILGLAAIFVLAEVGFAVQLLFIPQLINFLYSCPQLFKFYPCPRHRLTLYNIKNDTLTGVRDHMNLLNLSLRIIGPTNEGVLCEKLLLFQIVTSAVGIAIGACFQ